MHGGMPGTTVTSFFLNRRGRGVSGLDWKMRVKVYDTKYVTVCTSLSPRPSVTRPRCSLVERERSGKMLTARRVNSKCVHMRECSGNTWMCLDVNFFFVVVEFAFCVVYFCASSGILS